MFLNEYLIKEETLKSIANPLRNLVGTNNNMSTDEMISNLTNVNSIITDTLSVLAEKGISSNINKLSESIQGLYGASDFRTIYTGTTTPTPDIGVEGDIYIVIGG